MSSSTTIKVKKEEPLANGGSDLNRRRTSRSTGLSGTRERATKVKKEEYDDDEDDNKPILLAKHSKPSVKVEVHDVKKVELIKKTAPQENGKKKEKKVYDLPGQKRDPPEERDPLRIFYTSLHKQVPHSEMAQIWLMESGLLPEADARRVYERKQKKSLQKTPSKVVSTAKKTHSVTIKPTTGTPSSTKNKATSSAPSNTIQSKRKIAQDSDGGDDSDDDFLVSRVKKLRKT